MVGKIGRHLKYLSNGKVVVPRIYALDPAGKSLSPPPCCVLGRVFTGPGFEDNHIENFAGITKTDGAYVQIIHTNGGFLGMRHRVGQADFYPNGGEAHVS